MMPRQCNICGGAPAPHGLRPPGPRRDLPAETRGRYLWHCAAPACRAAALDRRDAFLAKAGRAAAPRAPDDPRPDPPRIEPDSPAQSALI